MRVEREVCVVQPSRRFLRAKYVIHCLVEEHVAIHLHESFSNMRGLEQSSGGLIAAFKSSSR